jgi:lipopolysaccharide/colanic/teichoic acid biosynthesis glycosyltransferase
VLGATVGLVLSSPLLAVIALLVRVTTPGPVFFRQQRVAAAAARSSCSSSAR